MILGRKVILRPFSEGFSEEELWQQYRWDQDREVVRWSNMSPSSLSFPEFVEQFEMQMASSGSSRMLFAILSAPEGALIGRIGLFNIDHRTRAAEVGIVIGERDYWSRNFGRDALRTLLDHVFRTTSLERIYLFTLKENIRARRCFAHSGFEEVAVRRSFSFERGEYEDVQMEISRSEWSRGRPETEPNQLVPHREETT